MVNNIKFLFLSILNFGICWPIPPAEVPVLGGYQGSDDSAAMPDYTGISDANIETEILSGNNAGSVSNSFGNNDGETIVDGGYVTENNGFIGDGGGYGESGGVKEAVLVPKRQRRILARYKVIIPVIIPQIRVRIPNRASYGGSYSDSYSGSRRISQNPG